MTIPSVGPSQEIAAATKVSEIAAPADTTTASSPSPSPGPLESSVLGPALAAIRELPEVDQAQVATLRDSLARGEIPFNAAKLAALIERYHRTGQ
ncbi:MAG: flagellar biosynthesis anti-sigma factor FlgM [Steroidobacteraceae bacterium]|jgi:negative regulator of flagellin synthesis FlgM